jgi:hypothetical protein
MKTPTQMEWMWFTELISNPYYHFYVKGSPMGRAAAKYQQGLEHMDLPEPTPEQMQNVPWYDTDLE